MRRQYFEPRFVLNHKYYVWTNDWEHYFASRVSHWGMPSAILWVSGQPRLISRSKIIENVDLCNGFAAFRSPEASVVMYYLFATGLQPASDLGITFGAPKLTWNIVGTLMEH